MVKYLDYRVRLEGRSFLHLDGPGNPLPPEPVNTLWSFENEAMWYVSWALERMEEFWHGALLRFVSSFEEER